MQAADAVAANQYVATVQLPGGDTPMESVLVPGTDTAGLAGVLKSENKLMASFAVSQGGHVVFSVVETGDTEMVYRVTYTPTR